MKDKSKITKDAQKLIAKGQNDKAIILWEKFVKDEPDANAYNTIGDLYLKMNKKDRAIEAFHRAAKIFHGDGFILKAMALNKKVINISPYDTEALRELGDLSEGKGLYADAMKNYMLAAEICLKKGQFDEFLFLYKKVLNLDPKNISLRNKIVEYYIKEGLKDEAAKEYLDTAMIYYEWKDYETVEDYIQKIIEINPEEKEIFIKISDLYRSIGQVEKSKEIMEKIKEQFPDDIDVQIGMAKQFYEERELDKSLDLMERVLERDKTNIEALKMKLQILFLQDRKDSAWPIILQVKDFLQEDHDISELVHYIKQYKETKPEETRTLLIELYQRLNQYEELYHEYKELGDICAKEDRATDALMLYREAYRLKPDDMHLSEIIENLEKEVAPSEESSSEEKTAEEILGEADVFIRYKLMEEAREILEQLKFREPESHEVHNRLKTVYKELNEKELFVTECIIIASLYEREGESKKKEKMINEAREFYPEDSRLKENIQESEEGLAEVQNISESENITESKDMKQFAENLSEADFYISQGLHDEALRIYNELLKKFPDNGEVKAKIDHLHSISGREISEEDESDVQSLFNKFKDEIDEQVDREDHKTHYNLGIGYKEMGLIDEAIREFEIAKNDKNIFTQVLSMLGHCYKEKQSFDLAVESFNELLKHSNEQDKSYWSTKYDIAEVLEESKRYQEALDIFLEVSSRDAHFREVDKKIEYLKKAIGESESQKSDDKVRKDRISYL